MAEPSVKARMLAIGGEPRPGTAEQFGRFIQAEDAKWARIVKDRNIPPLD
jgi:tripartite-type tricarboxylate transporter receptor subunit TctC